MLRWTSSSSFMASVTSGDRRLGVIVQTHELIGWAVMALEFHKTADSPESVFQDHAHKNLGKFGTVAEAFAKAEEYAKTWLEGCVEHDPCTCEEIPS